MPISTIQATVNATPDPSLGSDGAVTTPTNTGYASSNVTDSGAGAAQNKSIRWSAYPSISNPTKAVLKFDWNITAGGANTDISLGGTAAADASFISLLSVDGGASFPTTVLTRSCSISGNDSASLVESGSVSFDISPVPATDQVQIRNRMHANATQTGAGVASASVTATISNVALEVTTTGVQPILMV
jgi:hypothetical protein